MKALSLQWRITLMTVLLREVEIQKDKVIVLHLQKLHCLFTIVGEIHAVSKPAQSASDRIAQRAFIFNEQKTHGTDSFSLQFICSITYCIKFFVNFLLLTATLAVR